MTLRVRYVDGNGRRMADTFKATYKAGDRYSVKSPTITGYTADKARVSGTIRRNTEIVVTYTPNDYTLTVNFVDTDGNVVSAPYTGSLAYGEGYEVTSPTLRGYVTATPQVTGTMPARDLQLTVYYQPQAAVESGTKLVEIDDYATPLGLGGVALNTGICFE